MASSTKPRLSTSPNRLATSAPRLRPESKQAQAFYLQPAWRELVAAIILERGRRCEASGCRKAWGPDGRAIRLIGDHIAELQDGGETLNPANIRLLCLPCHNTKTARERAYRQARDYFSD